MLAGPLSAGILLFPLPPQEHLDWGPCPLQSPSPGGPTPAFLDLLLPTGSGGDWGDDSGKVIFLNRHLEIFKRGGGGGNMEGKGAPSGWHSSSSLSWSRRGRPQTGNHKSPQPSRAAGTLWFVVAGRRPEVLYLLTKMGKGRGKAGQTAGPPLPSRSVLASL